jgi:uncharacterized membrane protein
MDAAPSIQSATASIGWLSQPALRHPWAYLVFVAIAALDVIMTAVIFALGGNEANPVAALIIEQWGFTAAIPFKFAITLFVILVCEELGRQHPRRGWNLTLLAIAVSSLPVVYSLALIALHMVIAGH